MTDSCPCQSGLLYSACCAPFHTGQRHAPTAEALMRSRYTAFVFKFTDYLISTHLGTTADPATVAELKAGFTTTEWLGLTIDTVDAGTNNDSEGWVRFRARFRSQGRFQVLQERSYFQIVDGRWLYVSGDTEILALNPGRNDPCPCHSGSKFKKCCGR